MVLWIIANMMDYGNRGLLANTLVVRKVERTLKDSCFADLKWAIYRLGVEDYWKCTLSPLEMTYIPTGQKILFRGLDDPIKITSISVDKGSLCWCWIEEAYEIMNENDFNMLDESIRGQVDDGLFKQITLTLNPWNEKHWIKKRFFDVEKENTLAKTTNYMCNEYLDESDIMLFEEMKQNNPRRYRVAGLGEWGIVDGLVYENWEEKEFNIHELASRDNIQAVFGLDFGYTNDPTAFVAILADEENKKLYIFDEMYQKGMLNSEIARKITDMGYAKEKIICDSAEPKSIDELRLLGLKRVKPAQKGKDSVNNGIQYIQQYKIIIHPRCVNFITEISNYIWDKDKFNTPINTPVDDFNHLMDAMRYACEQLKKPEGVIFSTRSII